MIRAACFRLAFLAWLTIQSSSLYLWRSNAFSYDELQTEFISVIKKSEREQDPTEKIVLQGYLKSISDDERATIERLLFWRPIAIYTTPFGVLFFFALLWGLTGSFKVKLKLPSA